MFIFSALQPCLVRFQVFFSVSLHKNKFSSLAPSVLVRRFAHHFCAGRHKKCVREPFFSELCYFWCSAIVSGCILSDFYQSISPQKSNYLRLHLWCSRIMWVYSGYRYTGEIMPFLSFHGVFRFYLHFSFWMFKILINFSSFRSSQLALAKRSWQCFAKTHRNRERSLIWSCWWKFSASSQKVLLDVCATCLKFLASNPSSCVLCLTYSFRCIKVGTDHYQSVAKPFVVGTLSTKR